MQYGYDANGSMVTRGSQTIEYDADNRPIRVLAGGNPVCTFAYDGDGARRKRADASGTVHYVGDYERNATTGEVTKYYQAALGKVSPLIAFRRGGVLHYVGTDHLGSTIRVADASFAPLAQMRYKPFGGGRDSGSGLDTDHRFTAPRPLV